MSARGVCGRALEITLACAVHRSLAQLADLVNLARGVGLRSTQAVQAALEQRLDVTRNQLVAVLICSRVAQSTPVVRIPPNPPLFSSRRWIVAIRSSGVPMHQV